MIKKIQEKKSSAKKEAINNKVQLMGIAKNDSYLAAYNEAICG